MKFWRVNFKNPSISFKKRRLLRRVDRMRWYQVTCTRVDHGFTMMNILNLFEWIQLWWYFRFVILSMNFIAKERSRSIIIIFSRIYFKFHWNENIPSSISLSVKIYWYLNFNFLRLLGLLSKYILQGSYEDKIVDFSRNYRWKFHWNITNSITNGIIYFIHR